MTTKRYVSLVFEITSDVAENRAEHMVYMAEHMQHMSPGLQLVRCEHGVDPPEPDYRMPFRDYLVRGLDHFIVTKASDPDVYPVFGTVDVITGMFGDSVDNNMVAYDIFAAGLRSMSEYELRSLRTHLTGTRRTQAEQDQDN